MFAGRGSLPTAKAFVKINDKVLAMKTGLSASELTSQYSPFRTDKVKL